METYKQMYLRLFNAVTDAIKLLPVDSSAAAILIKAQKDCEEMCISEGEESADCHVASRLTITNYELYRKSYHSGEA